MNKVSMAIAMLLLVSNSLFAQVGINTNNSPADNSAMLDVQSSTKGMLVPRMTQSQIGAIALPANGLIVYCTTDDKFYAFVASLSAWKEILYGPGTISANTVPYVITSAVSNITQTTATSGGNATFDGGSPIIERGICWSTSPNPTIANSYTTSGAGNGVFVSNIDGLISGTLYYIRAFATNSLGTAYGNEITFTTLQVFYLGQNYGGGIVFYIDGTGQHGLIAAPNDQNLATWGCYGNIIGGTSTSMGTGLANTTAIVNGCSQGDIAAGICANLELNGYNDWFLPSRDELHEMYTQANLIGGFATGVYWSSSQWDANLAWYQIFYGAMSIDNKTMSYNVRAIRTF